MMETSCKVNLRSMFVFIFLFCLITQVSTFNLGYGITSPFQLFDNVRNYYGGDMQQTQQSNSYSRSVKMVNGQIVQDDETGQKPNYFGTGAQKANSYSRSFKMVNGKVVQDDQQGSTFDDAFTNDNGKFNEVGQITKMNGPEQMHVSYKATRPNENAPMDVNVFTNNFPEGNNMHVHKRHRKGQTNHISGTADTHIIERRTPDIAQNTPDVSSSTAWANANADTVTKDGVTNTAADADAGATATGNGAKASAQALVTAADNGVSSTAGAAASAATAGADDKASSIGTGSAAASTTNENSLWWPSWLSSSAKDIPNTSPYGLLKNMGLTNMTDSAMSTMYNTFSNTSNGSYLSTASTLMRVIMFFMPTTGLADQICFTMGLTKIVWEAACMYFEGYSDLSIGATVLPELIEDSYTSRRDESNVITDSIILPGETIQIGAMDVPTFLNFIQLMKLPPLMNGNEEKIRTSIESLVNLIYPDIAADVKTNMINGLSDTSKFLALFNTDGDLIVDKVDANFAQLFTTMSSHLQSETPLEVLRDKIIQLVNMLEGAFTISK